MIYVLLTYLFSPLLYVFTAIKKQKAVKRILVIQTAKIGDLICSTPVFREVKRKYPDAYMAVMIDPVTRELLEHNPHVNEIITMNRKDYKGGAGRIKLINLIRGGRYDIAICLNPNVPYAVSLFWALVPVRLSVMPDFSGATFRLASVFFTGLEKHVRGRQVIETYMRMLQSIDIRSSDISKEIFRSDHADEKAAAVLGTYDRPLVGIGISSGNKMKELGEEKIIALINTVMQHMDIIPVLIGSGQDKKASERIVNGVRDNARIINAAGRLDLTELPALLEKLSLYIGVDSGITYMADALSVPLINIAGPADMQDQRPTGLRALIIQQKLPCVPCSHAFKSPYSCGINTRECITSASVEEVSSSAEKMISGE